jgi:hypothetical protein
VAGDGWEEGGKEQVSRAVVYSSPDFCGKIKVKLIVFTKVKALFFLGLFYFSSLKMKVE